MKIYLDMDDVLVNYAFNVAKHFGLTMDELYARWPVGVYQIYHAVGKPDEDVWRQVRSQPPEFWASMPEFPWSRELFNFAKGLGDEMEILTSPINSWTCVAGKVQWLHKFAGDDFYQYHIAKSKWDCAQYNHILVDDKEDNINRFCEKGGHGVLFPAHGNRLHAHKNDPMPLVAAELTKLAKWVRAREGEMKLHEDLAKKFHDSQGAYQ